MKLSAFGEKFSGRSGIVDLMDDLGTALEENPDMIFMGGGNPSHIPEVEAVFQKRLEALLANPRQRHALLGVYQSPQGDRVFREELAGFLKKQFGWPVTRNNIAIFNGSQSAFFMLFNILAGVMPDGSRRNIHLPLAPEYLGYADVGLCDNFFTATRPDIELLDDNIFKYRLNYSRLAVDEQTAALCVSRPTNPTGNVLTDEEIEHLDEIARRRGIPLIIDGAYGLPFPNITFTDARPHWNENTALLLSLSKLGLPGARTGIVVANEELVQACTHGNTIASLASGTLGPAIATELFRSGDILPLTENYVRPFYRHRSQQTVQWFRDALGDLPYQIHKPEGAIFLWLWFEGLPISSQELYQRLKKRGVLVVSGHNFFIGLDDDWPHRNECLRVSYAMNEDSVKRGVEIIAEEVRAAWSDAGA